MNSILILLAVVYLLIGVVVYVAIDTREMETKLERKLKLWVLPVEGLHTALFPFVVLLWPVWLVINAALKE